MPVRARAAVAEQLVLRLFGLLFEYSVTNLTSC